MYARGGKIVDKANGLKNLTVGLRQSVKQIERDNVSEAIVAKDTDSYILNPFLELCKEKGIAVKYAESKKELGKMCRLDVGAAIAVIRKN